MALTSKQDKAVRLVSRGKVKIDYLSDDVCTATVEGDTDQYQVTVDPSGGSCTCKAWSLAHRQCSHMLAVEVEMARTGAVT